MSAMRVQRYDHRRRKTWLGCGCLMFLAGFLIVLIAGMLLILPALPAIAMRLAGFSPAGQTADLFANAATVSMPVIADAYAPGQITVDLGSYGTHNLPDNTGEVIVSQEQQLVQATFSEADLMALCRQLSALCSEGSSQYRNVQLDLRPGGAVLYADVTLPQFGLSQRAGVVLRLGDAARFEVAGVDVGGTLYEVPPEALGDLASEVERTGNDLLRQLSIRADGTSYTISEVYIDDHFLTAILR